MSDEALSNIDGSVLLLSIIHDGVELGKCGASDFVVRERPVGRKLYSMGSQFPVLFPSGEDEITAKAKVILIPCGKQIRFLMEMDLFSWSDVVFRLDQKKIDFYLQSYNNPLKSNDDVVIPDCLFVGVRK